jgi:hypothetical protein
MLYDLSKALDRERFKVRSNTLYKQGKTVELTVKHPKRSLPQNAYLHAVLSWFAIETGNTVEYVKQEYFKRLCNPDLFLSWRNDRFIGRVAVLRSSAELDTGQMTTAIERFRNWASQESGIYLPEPHEEDFMRTIQIEIERNKQYL